MTAIRVVPIVSRRVEVMALIFAFALPATSAELVRHAQQEHTRANLVVTTRALIASQASPRQKWQQRARPLAYHVSQESTPSKEMRVPRVRQGHTRTAPVRPLVCYVRSIVTRPHRAYPTVAVLVMSDTVAR